MKSIQILILSILLTGCSVSKYQMNRADELCEANGGTSLYILGADYEIVCGNGARFAERAGD